MNQILQTLRGDNDGGTSHGSTYYQGALLCPRRTNLDGARRIAEREIDTLRPLPSGALLIGIIFHKLAELYYSGKADSRLIEVSDIESDFADEAAEAYRLFEFHTKMVSSKDFWGDILSCEGRFDPAEAASTYFKVPTSFKPDLVIQTTAESFSRVGALTQLPIRANERYLVDWKTRGRKDALRQEKYLADIQGGFYAALWNLEFPEQPVCGTIFHEIYRHKKLDPEKSHQSFYVPTPEGEDLNRLAATLRNADTLLKSNLALPGSASCYSWNRECPHRASGQCKGV
jgi:hypothetical protein